jgi:hypothetical protein
MVRARRENLTLVRARRTVAAMTGTPTFDGTGAVASAADAEVYELGDAMLQLLLDASHTGGASRLTDAGCPTERSEPTLTST